MSSTQSASQLVVQCDGPRCNNHGNKWEYQHRGDKKYCSDECETRANGREALAGHIFDHCVCGTCFRELKRVEKPQPDREFDLRRDSGYGVDENGEQYLEWFERQSETCEAAIGFQYTTEHAGHGEKQRGQLITTGTICQKCGNTDHTHTDPDLADPAGIERLVDRLTADDDVSEFDAHRLHVEWLETRDLDLAVGRALEDDD